MLEQRLLGYSWLIEANLALPLLPNSLEAYNCIGDLVVTPFRDLSDARADDKSIGNGAGAVYDTDREGTDLGPWSEDAVLSTLRTCSASS